MRVKLLTLRYSPSLGSFDQTPLEEFIRDKEITAFREHFFTVEGVPHVACVLTWQSAVVGVEMESTAKDLASEPPAKSARQPRPDPVARLSESERLLYNNLREWRADLATKEGIPRYVILTNRQLALIVTKRPVSLTALGQIEGIGAKKVERYGAVHFFIARGVACTNLETAFLLSDEETHGTVLRHRTLLRGTVLRHRTSVLARASVVALRGERGGRTEVEARGAVEARDEPSVVRRRGRHPE